MDWMAFRDPGTEYRIHPFWFWNGEMNEQEIERQIGEMADKGIGGFFLCARQGMKVSYLSESWFAKVRVAVEAAKRHYMHVWLYDEYPYPSGIAGGEVTLLHPEAKHRTLAVTQRSAAGGTKLSLELPWARVLQAKAVPSGADGRKLWERAIDLQTAIGNYQAEPVFQKTGLTTYNQKRFFTYRTIYRLDWDVPAGEWDIYVFQEKEIEDFKYYGTFVDPCNKEAMRTFIRLTHERYERYLGDEFGKTVKGMFTDEIGLLGSRPWSPQLEGYFRERNGYSLQEHLPALLDSSYPDAARIRYDYYQSLHELLCESYHKQVHDWCEERGLQYVAEVPSLRMTTQRFSHVPGGDSGHEKLGRSLDWILRRYALSFRDNPKMTSSIARQLGRERSLDECFHSVGWSMNLQDAKWMIDRLAALGINFYNFHAFFYTLDGMTQHDAPPSQFYQNPYWPHFRQLGDYTGRISSVMSKGTADIRIAMLDPTTSLWSHMANPLHHFDYSGQDLAEKVRLERLKADWRSLHVYLLKDRRDFDHLDPELLAEANIENGQLRIGKAAYSVLILPPVSNLEQKAWEKIKAFLQAGGKVIGYGLLPYEAIEAGGTAHREAPAAFGLSESPSRCYLEGNPPTQPHNPPTQPHNPPPQPHNPPPQPHNPPPQPHNPPPQPHNPTTQQHILPTQQHNPTTQQHILPPQPHTPPTQQHNPTTQQHNPPTQLHKPVTKGPKDAYFIARCGEEPEERPLEQLSSLLDELLPRAVRLDCGREAPVFLMQGRYTGENEYVVFITNQEASEWDAQLTFDLRQIWPEAISSNAYETALLDMETGNEQPLHTEPASAGLSIPLRFGPYQSRMILLTRLTDIHRTAKSADPAKPAEPAELADLAAPAKPAEPAEPAKLAEPAEPAKVSQWQLAPTADWKLKALSPNALRLDRFHLRVGDGEPVQVQAKTFIDQCADVAKRQMLPVSFSQVFGVPMKTKLAYPLNCCRYTASFYVEKLPQECQLLMDESAISGEWTLRLNGTALKREDFRKQLVYDNSNMACDVRQALCEGWNELAIDVTVEHDWDGVTDAIYLYGGFAVTFDSESRPVVTEPQAKAATLAEDHYYEGYPYFAGTLSFSRTVTLGQPPAAETFELSFPEWDVHDSVEVLVNGQSLGVRPWSPFVWGGSAVHLREGGNELEVRVTGTLIGLLEGKYFDYREHRVVDIVDI